MFKVPLYLMLIVWNVMNVWSLDICEDQEDGARLAHPADCSRFIQCHHGETVAIRYCPFGLHFNRYESICDFKFRAGCDFSYALQLVGQNTDDKVDCRACRAMCSGGGDEHGVSSHGNGPIRPPGRPFGPKPAKPGLTKPTAPPPFIPTAGTPPSQRPTASTPCPTKPSTPSVPTAGTPPSQQPTASTPCPTKPSTPFVPTAGTPSQRPTAFTPTAGTPSSQRPTAFTPTAGTPSSQRPTPSIPTVPTPCPTKPPSGNEGGNNPQTPSSPSSPADPQCQRCADPGKCRGQKDGALFADNSSNGFIICQCQCEIKMPCPPGLVYNGALEVCDWPQS